MCCEVRSSLFHEQRIRKTLRPTCERAAWQVRRVSGSVILRRLPRKKSLVPAMVRISASGIAPTTAIVGYQLTDVASSSP
jgi:hypothetical protein